VTYQVPLPLDLHTYVIPYAAADAAKAMILGALFEARTGDLLRSKGTTYTLSSPVVADDWLHAVVVIIPLHPDKVNDGEAIMKGELTALATGDFSDDEVKQARAMAASFADAVAEDPMSFAVRLARDPKFDPVTLRDELNAVDVAQLRSWLSSTLSGSNLVRVSFSRELWLHSLEKRFRRGHR
jgi:hypothetical protein